MPGLLDVRIRIEFEVDDHAPAEQIAWVLQRAALKTARQRHRTPCICTAPEADDVLRDELGRIIGTVEATPENKNNPARKARSAGTALEDKPERPDPANTTTRNEPT